MILSQNPDNTRTMGQHQPISFGGKTCPSSSFRLVAFLSFARQVFKSSMSKLPEITSLFTALASKLRGVETSAENEDQNLDHAVGNLSRLLNLSETTPKVRVLDTALSLMCFTAPQIFDSMIEFMVKTIVTVLSSSVECDVVKCGSKEDLQIGGSISGQDCVGVIEACADVLQKLEAFRGDLSPSLLYAVVRVAALASRRHYSVQMAEMKATGKRNSAFAKLLCHSPRDFNFKCGEIPLRLLWWLLDPMVLKNDICQILQETTNRPFLCLEKEFYERTDWHSILICLVVSPTMFIETRALLHNWFLLTGLASVLELQAELVLRVLDVGSRPMWWGIPMEVALTLPFSHAYFPCENRLLRILAGPLSWENFRHLVEVIKPDSAGKQFNATSNQAAKASRVDHNSCWAMAINFPSWFFFASLLLFLDRSSKDNCYLKCISWLNNPDQSCGAVVPYSAAAARFIAWVLNPKGDSCQDLLVEYLTKLSNMWTLEHFDSRKGIESTGGNKNEVRRSLSVRRGNTNSSNFDCQTLQLWLKEVEDIHVRYSKKLNEHFTLNEADHSQGVGYQENALYRKIPLGILLGYSDRISDVESELLLHYAATGTLHNLCEPQVWQKHMKSNPVTLTDKYTRKEAVAGAHIAFHLTDATQSMSTSMFESEESGLNFLWQVKGKIGKYLLKCVKRLLQLNADEDYGQHTLRDLYLRMIQWKHQGQDICSSLKDWDDIIGALKCASASLC